MNDIGSRCNLLPLCEGTFGHERTAQSETKPATSVNPDHYQSHSVSPIDLIESYGFGPGFCAGNVIKYVARAEEKAGRVDLCKALWYLLRLLGFPLDRIKELTKEAEEQSWKSE